MELVGVSKEDMLSFDLSREDAQVMNKQKSKIKGQPANIGLSGK